MIAHTKTRLSYGAYFFLSKADLKRNISILQAEVQKKDGTLLFHSSVTVDVFVRSLCIALYRIPHFRSIEEIWAESNLAVVCGTKSRNSIVSEMAI